MNDAPRRIWILNESCTNTWYSGDATGSPDDPYVRANYVRVDIFDSQKAKAQSSALDAIAASGQAQEAWEAQKKAEAERDAMREVFELATELCIAVDCEAEDVGGQRKSMVILRELGPATDTARAALKQTGGK